MCRLVILWSSKCNAPKESRESLLSKKKSVGGVAVAAITLSRGRVAIYARKALD